MNFFKGRQKVIQNRYHASACLKSSVLFLGKTPSFHSRSGYPL